MRLLDYSTLESAYFTCMAERNADGSIIKLEDNLMAKNDRPDVYNYLKYITLNTFNKMYPDP